MIRKYKNTVRKGMKRYANRKKRVSRFSLTGDVTYSKVEEFGQLFAVAGTDSLYFSDTGAPYLPIYAIFQNSPSFTTQNGLYSRYKITGINVVLSPARGTNNGTLYPSISGVPTVAVGFFPNYNGTNLGTQPVFNDRRLMGYPLNTVSSSKTWRFPNKFYEGGAYGFGIWSQCQGYTSQVGQLAASITSSSQPTSSCALLNYMVTVYVQFSDKLS